MMKNHLIYISIALVLCILGAVGIVALYSRSMTTDTSDKLSVVTSFYPVYYFASEIGGEYAQVTNITPAGAEPHEYEPTAQDLVALQKAAIFVFNGAGLEPWGDRVLANMRPETIIVRTAEGLATLEGEEHGHGEEEAHADEPVGHVEDEAHITDPHIWLSPVLASQMVDKIVAGFVQADPTHAASYTANAEALKASLAALDTNYRQSLAQCASRDIVTSHAAFAYLADAYNLNQVAISGLSPEEEPSAQQLAQIANFARERGIKYIFFESLISPRLAQTIATEIGAQTLVLDPIEGIAQTDIEAGENYISVMERNLTNLTTALQCQR